MDTAQFDKQKQAYDEAIGKPTATLDVNPIVVTDDQKFVLAKRIPNTQEGGRWSFPGGKIFKGEYIAASLKRMTKLKTGLDIELMYPTLNESFVGVYDDPGRDPRAHVIGFAFLCKIVGGEIQVGGNSEEVDIFSPDEIKDLELAFDHREILKESLDMLSKK